MKLVEKQLNRVETLGNKVEMYTVDNFLSDGECDHLIGLIDANHVRSMVVSEESDNKTTVSDFRTSSSAFLDMNDGIVSIMNKALIDIVPEDINGDIAETPQGQLYEPGQYFNDHTDFFDEGGGGAYEQHVGTHGQRNWTALVYLNDVEEGGETAFPKLDLAMYPKKGKLVLWKNVYNNGAVNHDTLHAGRPVIKGKKYVITKWFRDGVDYFGKKTNGIDKPLKGNQISTKKFEIKNVKVKFKSKDDLPRFTKKGFEVLDLPDDVWNYIKDIYKLLEDKEEPELHQKNFIISAAKNDNNTTIFNMDRVHTLKAKLHDMLLPFHEEWIQNKYRLEPATCYGIRSYHRDSVLVQHTDRVSELHVSGIILVDQKIDEPWGLDIQDHDDNWHRVFIKPGQIIMYESATLSHGRDEPFKGEYFRNFFIHYKLKDWEYDS